MVNKRVRRELLAGLKISHQALSQRAKRLKEKHGPMTTDEAVYVIAHQEGIDLGRYLPLHILDRIRSLVPREVKAQLPEERIARRRTRISRKGRGVVSYPLIKEQFIRRAVAIGEETFPQLVVLENSIRVLIEKTLSAVRSDWWIALVPKNIQRRVQQTIDKEKKYPYRERRGNKPLMYCNFVDLKEIVIANRIHFQGVIVDIDWFKARMDEVYMARNNLAHSVLLSNDDISRITLLYRDWARLLEAAKIK